jgi:hypothetical protein
VGLSQFFDDTAILLGILFLAFILFVMVRPGPRPDRRQSPGSRPDAEPDPMLPVEVESALPE